MCEAVEFNNNGNISTRELTNSIDYINHTVCYHSAVNQMLHIDNQIRAERGALLLVLFRYLTRYLHARPLTHSSRTAAQGVLKSLSQTSQEVWSNDFTSHGWHNETLKRVSSGFIPKSFIK